MALLFEWDGKKAVSNEEKHGVTFEEAISVFFDKDSLTIDDPAHSEQELRLITLGGSHSGRLLVVVHTERDERIRIISARMASRKERTQYDSFKEQDNGQESKG
jgi:uncharacterized DUF497 family protein